MLKEEVSCVIDLSPNCRGRNNKLTKQQVFDGLGSRFNLI